MAISKHEYFFNEVYRVIANRLADRHKIQISDHIDTMFEIGARPGQGITFRPVDGDRLKSLLKMPAFAHDDRRNFCERVAAAATKGEGYREVGAPSLHCQIAANSCNIHLDSYGFVAIGPDGKKYYYSSPMNFRPLRPPLAPLGVVAETRHSPGYDSFPRLAQGREEQPRKTENPWATSIQPGPGAAYRRRTGLGDGGRMAGQETTDHRECRRQISPDSSEFEKCLQPIARSLSDYGGS